jgi:hypothetical protein
VYTEVCTRVYYALASPLLIRKMTTVLENKNLTAHESIFFFFAMIKGRWWNTYLVFWS